MMTSWHTGPLWGESIGHRWIPLTILLTNPVTRSFGFALMLAANIKAKPKLRVTGCVRRIIKLEQTIEQTLEWPVIWDAMAL